MAREEGRLDDLMRAYANRTLPARPRFAPRAGAGGGQGGLARRPRRRASADLRRVPARQRGRHPVSARPLGRMRRPSAARRWSGRPAGVAWFSPTLYLGPDARRVARRRRGRPAWSARRCCSSRPCRPASGRRSCSARGQPRPLARRSRRRASGRAPRVGRGPRDRRPDADRHRRRPPAGGRAAAADDAAQLRRDLGTVAAVTALATSVLAEAERLAVGKSDAAPGLGATREADLYLDDGARALRAAARPAEPVRLGGARARAGRRCTCPS